MRNNIVLKHSINACKIYNNLNQFIKWKQKQDSNLTSTSSPSTKHIIAGEIMQIILISVSGCIHEVNNIVVDLFIPYR